MDTFSSYRTIQIEGLQTAAMLRYEQSSNVDEEKSFAVLIEYCKRGSDIASAMPDKMKATCLNSVSLKYAHY